MPLVNPGSLFTFRFPCRKRKTLWPPASAPLDDACRLPSLAGIVGVPDLVSLWLAWNDGGLRVRGEMKGVGFACGLFFLPFVFLPILAFGSARYRRR